MKQEFVTLPREVVERAMNALEFSETQSHSLQYDVEASALAALSAALEQPQRKLTTQDIADGALLGNIESPFNACMHQEHCKRWKEQAEHQPPTTEESSAVEQPQVEQKPVAWISPSALEWITRESEKVVKLTRKAQPEYDFTEPLYTQPQPPRQPLTNEEIDAIAETMPGGLDGFLKGWGWRQFARAIEAAHNIK